MRLEPLYDRVIVEPIEPESVTAGGLLIPEIAQEDTLRGTVIAVGPGRETEGGDRIAVPLAPGDEIIYTKYAGSDYGGLMVLRAEEILAKVAES